MDQSIRLRRPEDDVVDQLEAIRAMSELCKNMSQMYTRLALPAHALGREEFPVANESEVVHGNR